MTKWINHAQVNEHLDDKIELNWFILSEVTSMEIFFIQYIIFRYSNNIRTCITFNLCNGEAAIRWCSTKYVLLKIRKIRSKAPVLELLFSKVAGLHVCNFIKKKFQHSCFLVNFSKFLRTPFLQNNSGWLLPAIRFHWKVYNK